MSDTTKIEWCDHSWSPWEGCTKVSPGCLNCYAEARDKRHLFGPETHWGKGVPRRLTKDWRKPVKWNLESLAEWDNARGKGLPLTMPPRYKVFPSVCDPFDAEAPVELLARFIQLIYDTPNLDWLLLTKRPENFDARTLAACQLLSESITAATAPMVRWLIDWRRGFDVPRNVWIGTSVEDQTLANQRVPALLRIPARLRFLSVEPLLGEIDLSGFLWGKDPVCVECPRDADCVHGWHTRKANDQPSLDWVIVGGESGRGARPCNVDWVRSIVMQCQDASVPCFVKQLGACPVVTVTPGQAMPDDFRAFSHPKGGDPAEWPEDLRVRQFPEVKP